MNKNIKKIFIFSTFGILFAPFFVSAANISFETGNKTFANGSDVLIQVLLDTEGASINAVEGKIVYPKNLVESVEIQDGNSAINFWIEKPHVGEEGTIIFSGITAGGISRPKALLFKVILRAKTVGAGILNMSEIKLLKNDGNGTEVKAKALPLSFVIEDTGTNNSDDLQVVDTAAPEDFMPIVGSSTDLFDGKYFLVFVAEDKGSGIDHYEVREGMFGKYIKTSSPFVLKNQDLDRAIYVKAVDKKGNEKVVKLEAEHGMPQYQEIMILAIMLLVLAFLFKKKIWRKSKK